MTIAPATDSPSRAGASPAGTLPLALSVLAVTARPGLESEDLGGLLYAFRRVGATLSLLCLTRGEGGTRNAAAARLEAIRPWELQLACSVLGVFDLTVAGYPDGGLYRQPMAELTDRVSRAIRQHRPDLLLIIAPEAGDRDDYTVAVAARAAAERTGLPVAGHTAPGAPGAWTIDLGADATTARAIQKSAAAAHTSQAETLPATLRRLDLLGDTDVLRWVLPPRPVRPVPSVPSVPPKHHEPIPAGMIPRPRPAMPADSGG
jgi:N-acetylglucosamine malate deacetylase 2